MSSRPGTTVRWRGFIFFDFCDFWLRHHPTVYELATNYVLEWDQGGLVIFAGHKWVKAGIEFYDCRSVASSVSASTDGADWSLVDLPHGQNDLRVRLEKVGTTLEVWFEDGQGEWKKLREVNWFFWGVEEKAIKVGVYASRPATLGYPQAINSPGMSRQNDNLVVEFEGLEIW